MCLSLFFDCKLKPHNERRTTGRAANWRERKGVEEGDGMCGKSYKLTQQSCYGFLDGCWQKNGIDGLERVKHQSRGWSKTQQKGYYWRFKCATYNTLEWERTPYLFLIGTCSCWIFPIGSIWVNGCLRLMEMGHLVRVSWSFWSKTSSITFLSWRSQILKVQC